MKPDNSLLGKNVSQGQPIGEAQDISKKYGGDCKPHIHWQIEAINPIILI